MKTFNDYINESKTQKYTHESVLRNVKDACGKYFKFIESSRYGEKLHILIKSVDGNITVTYDNSRMYGNKSNFSINVFSQNLTEDDLKDFVSLLNNTQTLVDRLEGLERAGQLNALDKARG